MQVGMYMNPMDNTPIFHEDYARVRRPAISLSDRRRSAPPRPPRPELNPWPKSTFNCSVEEVSSDDIGLTRLPYADQYGWIELRPQEFISHPKQDYAECISPISEEALSAGSNSSNVSPSNSLNKKADDRPTLRRPFSFESLRSAASCYSQDRMRSPHPEYLATATADFDYYADIAKSNPFDFQREIDEMRPYASYTYSPEPESEQDETGIEERMVESGVKAAPTAPRVRPHSFAVPMSRYNSQESQHAKSRVPPPSPDAREAEKTLDEAWMDIRKAIAPKLQIGMRPQPQPSSQNLDNNPAAQPTPPTSSARDSAISPRTSVLISTEHALPPNPPAPSVPSRNPRRLTVGVGRHATVSSANNPTSRSPRLSQSTSSPNISKAYYISQHDPSVPPLPALPPSEALLAHAHPVSPVPTTNLPIQVPAPLPTPAASDCSSNSHFLSSSSPISNSLHRASTHAPYRHHRYSSSTHSLASVSPSLVTPPLRFSTSTRFSMGQVSSTQASEQSSQLSSPRSRGFHEPPPVAPPRSQTVRNPPSQLNLHKRTTSDHLANGPTSPGIWTGTKAKGTTFTTQIWAGSPTEQGFTTSLGTALRSILPGESAARSSYDPPTRSQTSSTTNTTAPPSASIAHSRSFAENDSFLSPSLSQRSPQLSALPTPPSSPPRTQETQQTQETQDDGASQDTKVSKDIIDHASSIDPFAPAYTVPLSPKFRVTSPDDYLPKFSNNFAGFCKCAWRYQTAQTNKAFTLRNITRTTQLPNAISVTTKATTIKCKKCHFEGPLGNKMGALSGNGSYASHIDVEPFADQTPYTAHGVVYRWSFLFKSHVPSKVVPKKDESADPHGTGNGHVFACVFCCAEGKGTVCFDGAKTLCGHIAKCHPKGIMNGAGDRELRMRVTIVVGRRPDKGEGWDIILPGNRDRGDKALKNWLL